MATGRPRLARRLELHCLDGQAAAPLQARVVERADSGQLPRLLGPPGVERSQGGPRTVSSIAASARLLPESPLAGLSRRLTAAAQGARSAGSWAVGLAGWTAGAGAAAVRWRTSSATSGRCIEMEWDQGGAIHTALAGLAGVRAAAGQPLPHRGVATAGSDERRSLVGPAGGGALPGVQAGQLGEAAALGCPAQRPAMPVRHGVSAGRGGRTR